MARLNILKLIAPVAKIEAEPLPAPKPVAVPRPLCERCTFAHIEQGYGDERVVLCNLGFGHRLIDFPVRECSDFVETRHRTRRPAVGFAAAVAGSQ